MKSNNLERSIFWIVNKDQSIPILYDQNDAEVVGISAEALARDIKLITNISPALETSLKTDMDSAIIVGTFGKSKLIDTMIKTGKLSADTIKGKWESFLIQVVDKPFTGINKALVICGSDPRATAFGIFELSKRLGVSPWVYWADVIPAKRKNLKVSIDKIIMGPPSVKYRGIFLNDEDWGLQPWAARNIDTDIRDIGPHTYARIFELMLRLK
ncbi:MAG: glycosyl hydrolase 115 family protein, partial [Ignavibacteriaceae bacterium]